MLVIRKNKKVAAKRINLLKSKMIQRKHRNNNLPINKSNQNNKKIPKNVAIKRLLLQIKKNKNQKKLLLNVVIREEKENAIKNMKNLMILQYKIISLKNKLLPKFLSLILQPKLPL